MNLKEVSALFREKADKYHLEIDLLEQEINKYDRIINDLEHNHLSGEAQKLLSEKYRLNLTKGNVKIMLETLKTDLFVVKEKLKIMREKYKLSCFAIHALGYKQIALPFLVDFINDELRKSHISNVELIKINEKIKIHNTNVKYNQKNAIWVADLHLILDMLNQGYEQIEVIENKNADKLEEIIQKLKAIIDKDDLENIIDNLDLEKMYDNVYQKEDFTYIYTELLRHIQTRIYELVSLLKKEEYYFDFETLKIIKEEHKNYHNKYIFIREKIKPFTQEKSVFEESVQDEKRAIKDNAYKLYYASNSQDPTKCFFMRDLSSIREESLPRIWQLLKNFKQNEKVTVKHLAVSNYIEIKDDQIRIVLKPLGEGNYSVEGVFIKKSDNLREAYQSMFNRPIAQIDDDYASAVEEQMASYVTEYGRKGLR